MSYLLFLKVYKDLLDTTVKKEKKISGLDGEGYSLFESKPI